MKTSTFAFAAFLAASQVYGAHDTPTLAAIVARDEPPKQPEKEFPRLGSPTPQGCFASAGNMTVQKSVDITYLSSGSCNKACEADKFWVSGLHPGACYCGFAYPPANTLSKNASDCNAPCPGYPKEACGALGKPGFWSISNTGLNIDVESLEDTSSSTSSSTATPTGATSPDQPTGPAVVTETRVAMPSASDDDKKGGPNTAGIAAGVVVGVLAAAGLVGAAVFFIRRKRNAEIEEEHRRNAAVNAFINNSNKPPGSSGSISMTDARLDPVLANRRMSDGSIADNEDYSRRILRVTNA